MHDQAYQWKNDVNDFLLSAEFIIILLYLIYFIDLQIIKTSNILDMDHKFCKIHFCIIKLNLNST